jgi:drug/metabolite transporter (DMT)-like permease
MSETAVARTALAYLALAASMATVGTYVGFSKALVIVFPVFLLAGMRFAIGALAMAPWLRRPAGEAALDARSRRLLFLESLFGNFLFSICMLYGIRQSSALAAGVIMAALPAVVALLSWLLLGERVGARIAAGIACAIAGIALVALARDAEGELASGSLVGSALLLAAVTCEALYVVIGKALSASVGPKRISALINLWGLLLVAPFALWQLRDFSPSFIPGSSWVLLVVYSIAASVVTVWLWMTGMKHVPAASAGIFTVFLPVSAAAVGVLFYGEQFTTSQLAAFALALGGVVLATWPARRRR